MTEENNTPYLNNKQWKLIDGNITQFMNAAKSKYIGENGNDKFDENKFFRWFVVDFLNEKLSYFRHVRAGRKPYASKLLRRIEKKHDLSLGFFEVENKDELNIRDHFFGSMLFVRKYIKSNDIDINPEQEKKLVQLMYSDSIENGKFSDKAIKRYLDSLL